MNDELEEMREKLKGNDKLENALIRELSINRKVIPPSPDYGPN